MGCQIVRTGDGFAVIACTRTPSKRCAYCTRPHVKLCDFRAAPGKTCDAKLCGQCAVAAGPGRDHCRIHAVRGDREAA